MSFPNTLITENEAALHSFGTVAFSDPDIGDTHSFSISGNFIGGVEWFSIDVSSGKLVYNKNSADINLDYETGSAYSVQVTVTDGDSLSATATISVFVTDINESPVIVSTLASLLLFLSNILYMLIMDVS